MTQQGSIKVAHHTVTLSSHPTASNAALDQRDQHAAEEPSPQTKRNRRFTYLSKLAQDPSSVSVNDPAFYFSESEMRSRDPALYHHYIGRHIPVEERTAAWDDSIGLVERVYWGMDEQEYGEYGAAGMRSSVDRSGPTLSSQSRIVELIEEEQEEEEQEEKEESNDEANADHNGDARRRRVVQLALTSSLTETSENAKVNRAGHESTPPPPPISLEERDELRNEFTRIMKERFLDGLDGQYFRYEDVDGNAGLDDLETVGREAEEVYFDEDDDRGEWEDGNGSEVGKGDLHEKEFNERPLSDAQKSRQRLKRSKQEWARVWEEGRSDDGDYDY